MTEVIRLFDPPIDITLRRSAAARRVALRVSSLDGQVTLTLPRRLALGSALDFVEGREGWLRRQISATPPCINVTHGATIPLAGRPCRIERGSGRSIRQEGDLILVPGAPGQVGPRLGAWLKLRARNRLAAVAGELAPRNGSAPARLSLRDPRGRWGSCSAAGAVMLSWRLMLAPPAVFDYVVAHEVAHLVEMNHSPRFWAQVARLCPDHENHRRWLRAHGPGLHGYDFRGH